MLQFDAMGDERQREARRRWAAGVCSAQALRDREIARWVSLDLEERLRLLSQLTQDAARMAGHGAPARLQRHLGGIRRPRR
ncbi:MAG: hypothetical protein ACYCWW_03250 [Deltaproteobacteria bacterium]